jgi:enamine deaminase RidA (YjgF/YER057c/UK114 family)
LTAGADRAALDSGSVTPILSGKNRFVNAGLGPATPASSAAQACGYTERETAAMSGKIEARLTQLGIGLPEPTAPMANYVPFTVAGNLVFIAGQICQWNGERRHVGKLGAGIGVEEGRDAARLCALNILTHLRTACGGDLDRVRRVVQLRGFVNCTPDFTDMPQIVNGASDLMVEIFADLGRHARAAVGVASLPGGVAVEVEAVFEIG